MSSGYTFKKGNDAPIWHWLAAYSNVNYNGASFAYDGVRFIYFVSQYGSSSAVSTTGLYRYDTWSNAWQWMQNLVAGAHGADIEYDSTRNCLYFITGGALTGWYVLNLNTFNITIAGVVCLPYTVTTMTPVLPFAAGNGATLTWVTDDGLPAQIDTAVAAAGCTTTSLIDSTTPGTFGPGMIGLQVNVLSGAQTGQTGIISAVPNANTLTLICSTLTSGLQVGDVFEMRVPQYMASSATASTLTVAGNAWVANIYANSDVVILSGTGAGQRRRIASNDTTTLTLAGAVTGSVNTGNWTTTPDATSVFKIVPSSDFLYFQPGASTTQFYKIELSAAAPAWTSLTAAPAAISNGSNIMYSKSYAPFQLIAARGLATSTLYNYNIGLNTWGTLTSFWGVETISLGAGVTMYGSKRKLLIHKEGTNRMYWHDLTTGILEPAMTMPYAVPGAYDGKRLKILKSADGVDWAYVMRPGGQEWFRVQLEWV